MEQLWKEPKARRTAREIPTLDRAAILGEVVPLAEGGLSAEVQQMWGGLTLICPSLFFLRPSHHKIHRHCLWEVYFIYIFKICN